MPVRWTVLDKADVPGRIAGWLCLSRTGGVLCREEAVTSEEGPVRYVTTWVAALYAGLVDVESMGADAVARLMSAGGLTEAKIRQAVQSTVGMLFAGDDACPDLRALEHMRGVEDLKVVMTRFITPDRDLMVIETFTADAVCTGEFSFDESEGLAALLDLPHRFSS